MARTRIRATAVLLSVLSLGLLGGCAASKETRQAADKLADRLGTPSWASRVAVETGRDGYRNKDYVQTTVTLKSDAAPAEVIDFVNAFPGEVTATGLSDSLAFQRLRFVAAAGGTLDVDYGVDVVRPAVDDGVHGWFQVEPAFPTVAAQLHSGAGTDYRIDLGAADQDAVAAAYDRLATFHLGPTDSFDVLSTLGTPAGRLSRFESVELPTPNQIARWRDLVAAAASFPAELPATVVRLQLLPARTVSDLTFLAPAGTTPDTLTVAAFGDRLWPGIRPALSATNGLLGTPGPWTFSVSWAPKDLPDFESLMISVLSDQPITDNGDASTEWSREAKAYVRGLPARG